MAFFAKVVNDLGSARGYLLAPLLLAIHYSQRICFKPSFAVRAKAAFILFQISHQKFFVIPDAFFVSDAVKLNNQLFNAQGLHNVVKNIDDFYVHYRVP